jgi:hypothetical protein
LLSTSTDSASATSSSTDSTSAGTAEPLFIFGSHLSDHKTLVGDVGRVLAEYGITLFVAHDRIVIDSDWEDEIRLALDRSHAGLVFVHKGLKNSDWCDQEIGWLQGRHVPVMGLRFDGTPYGFFARYQARPVPPDADPADIAELTLDRIAGKPELALKYAASLVFAMNESQSYAHKRYLGAHECAVKLGCRSLSSAAGRGQVQSPGARCVGAGGIRSGGISQGSSSNSWKGSQARSKSEARLTVTSPTWRKTTLSTKQQEQLSFYEERNARRAS